MDVAQHPNSLSKDILIQQLKILFYIRIAYLMVGVLHNLPMNTNWVNWLQYIATAGMIYCMLRLGVFHPRYKKAGVLQAVYLILTLVNIAQSAYFIYQSVTTPGVFDLTFSNTLSYIIGTVAIFSNWVAIYQLYNAHGDMVADQAPDLARKWRNMFWLSIGVGLLTTFASLINALLAIYMDINISEVVPVVSTLIPMPNKILWIIGFVYMYRTIRILEKE